MHNDVRFQTSAVV